MVLIDSKTIFELPVGLANPMVLIDSKSIFELSVDVANPMVLVDSKSMVLIDRVYLSVEDL